MVSLTLPWFVDFQVQIADNPALPSSAVSCLKFVVPAFDVVRSARALCAKVVPHQSVAFNPLFGNVVCEWLCEFR